MIRHLALTWVWALVGNKMGETMSKTVDETFAELVEDRKQLLKIRRVFNNLHYSWDVPHWTVHVSHKEWEKLQKAIEPS